jgi:hypothetical protein
MHTLNRYFFAALLSVFISSGIVAQDARPSPHAPAVQAAAAAPATAKPARASSMKPAPEKYFVEAYSLPSVDLPVDGDASCSPRLLHFGATNASEVAKLLGGEPDFTLTAILPNRIAIYYKSPTAPPTALRNMKQHIAELSRAAFSQATAIRVHGSAEKTVAKLVIPADRSITVKAMASGCVLIVSNDQSDPITIAYLTKTISGSYWQESTAAPTQRLFYVDKLQATFLLRVSGTCGSDS